MTSKIKGGFPPFIIKNKTPISKNILETRGYTNDNVISIDKILSVKNQVNPFLVIDDVNNVDETQTLERLVFEDIKPKKNKK